MLDVTDPRVRREILEGPWEDHRDVLAAFCDEIDSSWRSWPQISELLEAIPTHIGTDMAVWRNLATVLTIVNSPEVVAALRPLVDHANERVANDAVYLLAKLDGSHAEEALVYALDKSHGSACQRARDALVSRTSDLVRNAMRVRLGSPRPGVQIVAIDYLSPLDDVELRRQLPRLAQSSHEWVARAALRAIGSLRVVEGLDACISALSTTNTEAAAMALGVLGEPRGTDALIAHLDALTDAALTSEADWRRKDDAARRVSLSIPVVKALGELQSSAAIPSLVRTLGFARVASAALEALNRIDSNWSTRLEARAELVYLLDMFCDSETNASRVGFGNQLQTILGDRSTWREVGGAVAKASQIVRDATPFRYSRRKAVGILASIGDPSCIEPLVYAAAHRLDPAECARGLRGLGWPECRFVGETTRAAMAALVSGTQPEPRPVCGDWQTVSDAPHVFALARALAADLRISHGDSEAVADFLPEILMDVAMAFDVSILGKLDEYAPEVARSLGWSSALYDIAIVAMKPMSPTLSEDDWVHGGYDFVDASTNEAAVTQIVQSDTLFATVLLCLLRRQNDFAYEYSSPLPSGHQALLGDDRWTKRGWVNLSERRKAAAQELERRGFACPR